MFWLDGSAEQGKLGMSQVFLWAIVTKKGHLKKGENGLGSLGEGNKCRFRHFQYVETTW
jgi:hypothetical protein